MLFFIFRPYLICRKIIHPNFRFIHEICQLHATIRETPSSSIEHLNRNKLAEKIIGPKSNTLTRLYIFNFWEMCKTCCRKFLKWVKLLENILLGTKNMILLEKNLKNFETGEIKQNGSKKRTYPKNAFYRSWVFENIPGSRASFWPTLRFFFQFFVFLT